MMRCTQRLLTIQLCHQSSEEPGRELSPYVCHQGSAHPMVSEYMFNEKLGSTHSIDVRRCGGHSYHLGKPVHKHTDSVVATSRDR